MIKSLRLLTTEEKPDGTTMPIVEVICDGGRYEKGYLTPFRGYRFQVSGTKDGQGDCGSSQVVGLGNIVRTLEKCEPIGKEATSIYASNTYVLNGVLEDLALLALAKFDGSTYLPSECWRELEQFICETIDYINGVIRKGNIEQNA